MPEAKKSKLNLKRNTTDPDSRLMKMKRKDFANGYNVQNITENGFILSNYVGNSSSDQNTLIPTIKKLRNTFQSIPKRLLADKGYSTVNNYSFCEGINIDAYIPPHHESIDILKYKYDKKSNTYTDWQGKIFFFKQNMNRNGVKSIVYQYINKKTDKKTYIHVNHDWIKHCKKQKKKLSAPQGKRIYKLRGHDVEGVFGNIKKNLKFTHFNLRGFRGVKTEWNLISIAHNIQKLTTT